MTHLGVSCLLRLELRTSGPAEFLFVLFFSPGAGEVAVRGLQEHVGGAAGGERGAERCSGPGASTRTISRGLEPEVITEEPPIPTPLNMELGEGGDP